MGNCAAGQIERFMPLKIQDILTDLPITRQEKYQLRQRARRRCPVCGCPARGGYYCARHAAMKRLRQNALWQKRKLMVRKNGGKINKI